MYRLGWTGSIFYHNLHTLQSRVARPAARDRSPAEIVAGRRQAGNVSS